MARITDATIEKLTEEIRSLSSRVAALKGEQDYLTEARQHADTINELKTRIETMRIEKMRLEEERARDDRELEHKLGLERKRQEWEHEKAMQEVDSARREALIELREENLEAQRESFDKQMQFITKRFEKEIKAQREMLERLVPDINVALANDKAE